MATWDGSQWWVFNVVLDWKLLYNAGVKSLLKIYTDQTNPKEWLCRACHTSEALRAKSQLEIDLGWSLSHPEALFVQLIICVSRLVFITWKLGLDLLLRVIEAIENWKGVRRGRLAKGLNSKYSFREEVFLFQKEPVVDCSPVSLRCSFSRSGWIILLAWLLTRNHLLKSKPRNRSQAAKSSLTSYLRINTELLVQ